MQKISIVLPCYNEASNIVPMFNCLNEICTNLNKYTFEYIFVNDGSNDDTLIELKKLAEFKTNIKVISFTRNFGHQAALTAGLHFATGDAIITMDCDFQDPPELIPQFIAEWEKGKKIVYGRRKNRRDSFFKRISAKVYYKLLELSSEVKIYGNIADYRLIDKEVWQYVKKHNITTEYLRGILPWLGFKYSIIDYERPARKSGRTKFSLLTMIRFALQGLLSFSILPLRLGLFVGIFVIFTGIIFVIYLFCNFYFNNQFYKLLEWLAAFNYILIGFLFVLVWILAEYIFRISNRVQGMPMYVIDEIIESENEDTGS